MVFKLKGLRETDAKKMFVEVVFEAMGWCHWWLMLNADANLRFENLRFFGRLFPLGSFHHCHCSYCIKHHKTHACTHFFLYIITCFYSLNIVCCPFWNQVLFAALSHWLFAFLSCCLACVFFFPARQTVKYHPTSLTGRKKARSPRSYWAWHHSMTKNSRRAPGRGVV